jgi:hypothetical protein
VFLIARMRRELHDYEHRFEIAKYFLTAGKMDVLFSKMHQMYYTFVHRLSYQPIRTEVTVQCI